MRVYTRLQGANGFLGGGEEARVLCSRRSRSLIFLSILSLLQNFSFETASIDRNLIKTY
jgi:hypothetical protein